LAEKGLARQNAILWNPASDIDLPKIPFRIPRDVLTHEEAERVLAQPNLKMPEGLRDRAIFETFYSTGMRRCELIGLHLHDVDADRCTILIRDGKGRRDRMVPLGQRAQAWIFKYTSEARPKLVTDPNDTVLFVSNRGEALAEATLSAMARDYIVASGVNKHGACHIFRHSMATAMLENGADVRFIQAILGHTSLNSTAIYTHVAIRKLVEIHERTHPAAMLKRKARTGTSEPEAEKMALLAALDDEPEGHDDGP